MKVDSLNPLGMNRSDITNLYVKNVQRAAFVPGESAHLLLNQVDPFVHKMSRNTYRQGPHCLAMWWDLHRANMTSMLSTVTF